MSLLGASLLRPVVALNLWTFTMEAWMYGTRIPAVNKYLAGQPLTGHNAQEQMQKLPAEVRWKADNYNHLFEQPVQFYSVALSLVFLGAGDDDLMTKLAWSYVGFRVIHSLVQSTINRIMVRFTFFMLSSLTLFGMTAKAAMMLF